MPTSLQALAQLWLVMWPAFGPATPAIHAYSPTLAARVEESPAALLTLSDEELFGRVEADPGSVGPLSIGAPGSGVLFNAVVLPEDPRWTIAPADESWATTETVAAIEAGIGTVHELFPDTLPIRVGDISDPDGGRLKRHETHQTGRDVDVGFYFKDGPRSTMVVGTAANLDLPRNWALLRAWLTRTDVECVLLDSRIQKLLYKYALSIGEDKDWLDRVFRFPRGLRTAPVFHVRNHRNHYHVRFYNPVAQEMGRRVHPMLVQLEIMKPPVYTVRHVVRPGQTLGHIADRYGTSVRAIMAANGLRSTQIRAGRSYRIPVKAVAPPSEPVVVPPRLLPSSTPEILSAIEWPTATTVAAAQEASRPPDR
jgi:penicillin-insensitive murein endopeptidase